jgi:hypothetical protein
VAFRSTRLRLFGWLESLGSGFAISWLRSTLAHTREQLPDWVLYSLPDGLWLFSLLLFLCLLWRGDERVTQQLQLAVTLGAVAHEAAQAAWPTTGTFSWGDMTAYGLAALGARFLTPFDDRTQEV